MCSVVRLRCQCPRLHAPPSILARAGSRGRLPRLSLARPLRADEPPRGAPIERRRANQLPVADAAARGLA
eukprot:779624-Prymnesium_polylepis.1